MHRDIEEKNEQESRSQSSSVEATNVLFFFFHFEFCKSKADKVLSLCSVPVLSHISPLPRRIFC